MRIQVKQSPGSRAPPGAGRPEPEGAGGRAPRPVPVRLKPPGSLGLAPGARSLAGGQASPFRNRRYMADPVSPLRGCHPEPALRSRLPEHASGEWPMRITPDNPSVASLRGSPSGACLRRITPDIPTVASLRGSPSGACLRRITPENTCVASIRCSPTGAALPEEILSEVPLRRYPQGHPSGDIAPGVPPEPQGSHRPWVRHPPEDGPRTGASCVDGDGVSRRLPPARGARPGRGCGGGPARKGPA
jgi:hypothetical protein